MSRSDLKSLGELLDNGTSGLLVVAATDVEARVDAAITRTKKRAKAKVQADADEIKKEIDLAA
jgi:23S rRNA-/tRNA-specific pseudouridylate synthase